MKATCYHFRDQEGRKVLGGTIGVGIDLNAAGAGMGKGLEFVVTPSGGLSFAHNGKPVWIYLSVDPNETPEGRAFLAAHKAGKAVEEKRRREAQDARDEELQEAIDALGGTDAALEILKRAKVSGS